MTDVNVINEHNVYIVHDVSNKLRHKYNVQLRKVTTSSGGFAGFVLHVSVLESCLQTVASFISTNTRVSLCVCVCVCSDVEYNSAISIGQWPASVQMVSQSRACCLSNSFGRLSNHFGFCLSVCLSTDRLSNDYVRNSLPIFTKFCMPLRNVVVSNAIVS